MFAKIFGLYYVHSLCILFTTSLVLQCQAKLNSIVITPDIQLSHSQRGAITLLVDGVRSEIIEVYRKYNIIRSIVRFPNRIIFV